jgi:2-iminobutanoate/2-iminopropanoate deaminase
MSGQQIIDPGFTRLAPYPFSPAVLAGRELLIGGQLPFALDGSYAGDGMRAQATQIFANVGEVLRAAGGSFADVVRVTTYFNFDISDATMVKEYIETRAEFITHHAYVSAGVQVARLFDSRALLEVETTAVLDPSR